MTKRCFIRRAVVLLGAAFGLTIKRDTSDVRKSVVSIPGATWQDAEIYVKSTRYNIDEQLRRLAELRRQLMDERSVRVLCAKIDLARAPSRIITG